MRRVLLLILFFSLLIFLHAMAMSDGTDNTIENKIVYGFTPDHSRWNNYAIESDDTIYFYDTKSVIKKNDNVKVWIRFGEPINDNKDTRLYKEAMALKEIDCNTRLIRSIEWNYSSMKDEHKKYTSPTKWENIEPETSNDALLDVVCTQPKKRKKR
ncbi:surface-adhesin E family protein [Candidatus Deferrimicrobium sp.]|uniref:surface-adhesin E family protein n=1 Tax=Candidatus Deferrimicrobium sp. TaxID=3060586 RepID=UPI002EDA0535